MTLSSGEALYGTEEEASAYAQLSDLLSWERKQRSAAQARVLALEDELSSLQRQAVAAEKELQRQAAAAAAGGSTSAERVLTMEYERQLSAERAVSAELQVMAHVASPLAVRSPRRSRGT